MVLSLSGCGGSGGGTQMGYNPDSDTTAKSAQSRRMIIKSPAFKRDGTYSIFRGDKVAVSGTSAKYYLAPVERGSETITFNLEYASAVSEDLPFVITDSDDSFVLFSYNPDGTTSYDTATPYKSVIRTGGATQKLEYTNLTLTGSAVDLEESEGIIDIVLKSDGTATADGTAVPSYDYVWHVDPQHPEQYWTLSGDSTVLYEDDYEDAITSTNNGIYIAHDVRYTPNTLNFTGETAEKDGEKEYVVYYDFDSDAVKEALADIVKTYGSAYSTDKYILATLPMQVAGMGGGMPGGGTTPPGGGTTPPGGGTTPPGGGNPPKMSQSFSAAATDTSSIPAFSTMTHSASDAYKNPVLHITEPGTYRLSGKWHGQIWIEVGKKAKHTVGLILNGVEVSCDVAPALVFYKVYKWAEDNGYDNQNTLKANDLWKNIGSKMLSDDYYVNGAIVEIADGTTNNFTGANVYRLLKLYPKVSDDSTTPYTLKYSAEKTNIGNDIGHQDKMYKLDGAFHSRRTMVIGGGENGTGVLNITSTTCEGLDSEMHMLINGGNINVTAPDDGINVNEDNVSVFQMDSGTLTVSSTGGDGIDSNGWISLNGGTINITAGNQKQNSAGEAGLDAENGVNISSNATYNWIAASGGGNAPDNQNQNQSQSQTNQTDNGGTSKTGSILPVTETTQKLAGDSEFTLFPDDDSIEVDTEGDRDIPTTGDVFRTVHRVNDFGGLKVK